MEEVISKEKLLFEAPLENDADRFDRLKKYDRQNNGVILYRYRHVSQDTPYEIAALSDCKVWASNPKYFDDENEFLPSCSSRKDYECLRYFANWMLEKSNDGVAKKKMAELDKVYHKNPKMLFSFFIRELEKERCQFAVSCFTENGPFDDKNMWHQYAKDSGICLAYSLSTLVSAKVVIDPVYYIEPEMNTLGTIFELFGKNYRASLSFCIKDKYGIDKYGDPTEKIYWEKQNEWRYAIDNIFDETSKEYSRGRYLDCKIVPDAIYVKNLKLGLLLKVIKAANKNKIPVRLVL